MNNPRLEITIRQPAEGEIVETKIDDAKGARNEGTLKRRGNLWFVPDGSMYVYYRPTHWRPISTVKQARHEAMTRESAR